MQYQNWPVGGAAGTGTGWRNVFAQWQHKASEVQQVPYHLTLDADIQRCVRMEAREGQREEEETLWEWYLLQGKAGFCGTQQLGKKNMKSKSSKNLLVQFINEGIFWAYR